MQQIRQIHPAAEIVCK